MSKYAYKERALICVLCGRYWGKDDEEALFGFLEHLEQDHPDRSAKEAPK